MFGALKKLFRGRESADMERTRRAEEVAGRRRVAEEALRAPDAAREAPEAAYRPVMYQKSASEDVPFEEFTRREREKSKAEKDVRDKEIAALLADRDRWRREDQVREERDREARARIQEAREQGESEGENEDQYELIPYVHEDIVMLPVQTAGICYLYAALNAILNTPLLFKALTEGLERRILESPFNKASEERRKFVQLNQLSISRASPIAFDAASHGDEVREILQVARTMDKGALVSWIRDTVLYGTLRAAKQLNPIERGRIKSPETDALLSMAGYKSFTRRMTIHDAPQTMPTKADNIVKAFNEWASSGRADILICDIMRDFATVEDTKKGHNIHMKDGSVIIRSWFHGNFPQARGDHTGIVTLLNSNGEGHVISYVRDPEGTPVFLDSNQDSTFNLAQVEAYYRVFNNSKIDQGYTLTPVRRVQAGGDPSGVADVGPREDDETEDALTASVLATNAGLSQEALSVLPAEIAEAYAAAVDVLDELLDLDLDGPSLDGGGPSLDGGSSKKGGALGVQLALMLTTIAMATIVEFI